MTRLYSNYLHTITSLTDYFFCDTLYDSEMKMSISNFRITLRLFNIKKKIKILLS